MSDLGSASVTIRMDARSAEREFRDLVRRFASEVTRLRIDADARNIRPEIEGAVAAANTQVTVTSDTSEIVPDIEGAVDAADTETVVTADAKDVTGSIDGAVDAADTHVEVTGEAAQVTGAIDGAVQAADTDVNIGVGGAGELAAAGRSANFLNSQLIASGNSGTRLRTILQLGAFGVVAKQIVDAAQAASDLAESTSKAEQVFRGATQEVLDFGATSATSVGLASRAAIESAGTFGNLFTAMGVGRAAAAGMSTEVIQLGADLASFNNLGVDDTLDRIRSGLVGEIEPLRQLGISFNAAQVEAKAMELGLAGANGEVSEGAKVQARLALITEQSSNAAGDFARTSDGLANQQRIVTAEFQNAVTEIGQGLLPLFLDVVTLLRNEGIPAFTDLATSAVPVLTEAISALLPLLGSATRVFIALSPVLTTLASVIDAIPDPILQMAAALALLSRTAGPAGRLLASLGDTILNTGRKMTTLSASTLAVSAALAAVTLAVTIWGSAQADAARNAAEIEQQTDAFAASLGAAETAAEGLELALRDLIESGEDFQSTLFGIRDFDVAETLRDAGLTVDQFSEAVIRGGSGLDILRDRLIASGEAGAETAIELRLMEEQLQAGARQAIDAAVALDTYTEQQADAAVEANTAADGSVNYAGALEDLKTEVAATADEQETATAALAAMNAELTKAVQVAPGLGEALRQIRIPGGDLTAEMLNLTVAMSGADLSAEQLQAIAESTGINLDVLAGHVENVRGVIQELQGTATGAVPGIDSIASQIDDLANVSAAQLETTLRDMLADLQAFNDNIALVMAERPLLAGIAAQAPEFAALLGGMIRDGKTAALDELELLAAGVLGESQQLPQIIRDNSPAFVKALEDLGLLGTESLTAGFTPETPTRTKMQESQVRIRAAKEGIQIAAQETGAAGAAGYATGLSPVPGTAATDFGAARNAIAAEQEPHRRQGSLTAGASASAYQAAMAPVSTSAAFAMEQARLKVEGARSGMRTAGSTAGSGASGGFSGGLAITKARTDEIIRKWRTNIISGIGTIFEEHSPSQLMFRHGQNVAEGFVQGIVLDRNRIRPILAQYARTIGALFGGNRRGTGIAGLQEPFASQVAMMLAATRGAVTLVSGWRSTARQAALYAAYVARGFAPPRVAPPGRSKHEQGLAVDLGGDRALYTRWAHLLGWKAPVPGEPWHWQPGWTTRTSLYEQGAWRTANEFAQLHADEMVLPARIAAAVRAFLTSSNPEPGGTRDVAITIRIGNVYGVTAAEMRALGEELVDPISQALAERKVRFAARVA